MTDARELPVAVVDASHSTEESASPITLAVDGGSVAVALIGLLFAPFRDARQVETLIAHAFLIFGLVGLRRLVNMFLPPRPVHTSTLLLVFGAIQPVMLIIATIIEGDVTYRTGTGHFSHHDQTVRVALATFLHYLGVAVAALFVGNLTRSRKTEPTWPSFLAAIDDKDLRTLQLLGAGMFLSHFALTFVGATGELTAVNTNFGPLYALQVAIGALSATVLFVGVALRRGLAGSRALFGLIVVAAAIFLAGGNRGASIGPLLFVAVGYMLLRRMPRHQLIALGAIAVTVAFGGLVVGEIARSDGAGRSNEVALQRISQFAEGNSKREVESDTVRTSTLHRILRNSTHTTMRLVPETIPFDDSGVSTIPTEVSNTLLPSALRGVEWKSELRAMFLNDLGYIINEYTAVEFACLADAWWRGGYWAVFVIGLILGTALQLAEWHAYRGEPLAQATKLLAILAATYQVEGRDIVFGLRRLVLTITVVTVISWALTTLSRAPRAFVEQRAAD